MIYEHAEIDVAAENMAAFEAGAEQAKPLFLAAKGCHGMQLTRSIENPGRYRLLVLWETVEDHMVGFRNAPEFAQWRALVGGFFTSPPRVEHLDIVVKGRREG